MSFFLPGASCHVPKRNMARAFLVIQKKIFSPKKNEKKIKTRISTRLHGYLQDF
jgi:hypothetical protein